VKEGDKPQLYDPQTRTLLQRDIAAERTAGARLDAAGCKFQWSWGPSGQQRRVTPSKLNKLVLELCAEGWQVEAEGRLYRQPGQFKLDVRSGIDWFELEGSVDFGNGVSAKLPRLLAALRKGEKTVQLDDGTMGILPDQWLSRYGLLARVSKDDPDGEDVVRFSRGQVGLLDALVSNLPQATCDAVFEQAREELRSFEGVAPAEPTPEFVGELRPYQKQGLGWLNFLHRFGFGGCLADDMGLGKTVQVLARLQSRKQVGKPSLVVVPKSLVFNWLEEAKRFTPELRMLDHTGVQRMKTCDHFKDYNVILTTYGTMRLDATFLKDFVFDYAILDEAQAIKNSASESAKAARLIRADHRLALSGTPVQNHLGELWSLFEFLNPGMLGAATVFKASGAGAAQIEKEGRELLSRALRPFILRRTKEQVATDLPAKTEQTIWCELDAEQRKLYDELKQHYRNELLGRIATEGINKAKIQILEALLRLRQAACHPGLIDKKRSEHPSAKLDVLLPQITEVIDEGHKVLVFSQFTSMLAILKLHLDKQKTPYEYLDGKTRDRQQRVERFQKDPDCKLFLISLKAGGLGLNLTAAEYVFLLDPWWNPAVEAQAIDRAHRIGQTRKVFAYRLIAKDTVEQKVLDLQAKKKDLADMILNADSSLISQLKREDLELLLA
jgi:SNF2 family DNA or RNA helicase